VQKRFAVHLRLLWGRHREGCSREGEKLKAQRSKLKRNIKIKTG
jgi:hypothetical protein